jgi:hypothetical protein
VLRIELTERVGGHRRWRLQNYRAAAAFGSGNGQKGDRESKGSGRALIAVSFAWREAIDARRSVAAIDPR